MQQAFVGYVYGDSTCGQRAIYEVGMTGIPIYNVNNNCATGGTVLYLGKQAITSGLSDCVLALGFEKVQRGSLITDKYKDRANPLGKHIEIMTKIAGFEDVSLPLQIFNHAGVEHMNKYGTRPEHFAKIAYKNHKHSVNNPNAQFQNGYSLQEVLNSPRTYGFLTRFQSSPSSDGAAAAVLASEKFVKSHGLEKQAIEILGMEMATDLSSTFTENSCIKLVGHDMTKSAAERLFKKTDRKPSDVQVVELHDGVSVNELITYEALGLCEQGKGGDFVDREDNTYGGKYVVNPSGGLIARGHPLGATGLAQCAELCWQLRGEAGKRQVEGATLGLQHNLGLGGAVVVGLYSLGFPDNGATDHKKDSTIAVKL